MLMRSDGRLPSLRTAVLCGIWDARILRPPATRHRTESWWWAARYGDGMFVRAAHQILHGCAQSDAHDYWGRLRPHYGEERERERDWIVQSRPDELLAMEMGCLCVQYWVRSFYPTSCLHDLIFCVTDACSLNGADELNEWITGQSCDGHWRGCYLLRDYCLQT